MPGVGGVGAIRELRRARRPAARAGAHDVRHGLRHAAGIEAGATGYLLKDTPRDELFDAVRAAAAGEAVLSPAVARGCWARVRRPARTTR